MTSLTAMMAVEHQRERERQARRSRRGWRLLPPPARTAQSPAVGGAAAPEPAGDCALATGAALGS